MEARVVVCLNPFDRDKNIIETVEFEKRESLLDFKNEYFENDVQLVTVLNGKVIPFENLPFVFPKNNSEIIFTPVIGEFFSITAIITAIVTSIIATGIAMLVGLLMPKPDMGDSASFDSTVYGWNQYTKQQAGLPLFTYYGLNKVNGNVIAAFTESNWTDKKKNFQYLNLLIGIGEGPIADISAIEINQRDIDYYDAETLDWEVHLGTVEQIHDSNFAKIVNEIKYDFEITSGVDWEYFETDEADVFTSVELDFIYPNGLYRMATDGDVEVKTLILYIQYKKSGDDETWQDAESISLVDVKLMSVQFRTCTILNLTGGKYYFRVKRDLSKWTYPDGSMCPERKQMMNSEEVRLDALRMIDNSSLAYPRTAYVSVKVKATDQISGSLDFQCMVKGKIVRVYDGANWSFEYSTNPAWVCFDILTQPVIEGDGANEAFSCSRYNGIDPNNVDEDAFLAWANWCDDIVQGEYKRCDFNGGFDTETSMWEAALQVCLVGRAVLLWEGLTLSVTYDHPVEPVQLFSVGNLGISSVKKRWTTQEERANVIEAEFVNEKNNYERDVLSVVHTDIGSANQITRVAMFGITNENQAIRLAKYFLLLNYYCKYTVEWESDVEAVNCTIGDVAYLQHSFFKWGSDAKGGLIVSDSYVDGSYHKILTDAVCEIDPVHSTDYYLYVRFADGTIEYENVISVLPVGATQTLITTDPFTQLPAKHDRYIFGNATLSEEKQKVKITDMEITNENKLKFSGLQYDARVYRCDSLLANFNSNVTTGTDPTTVSFTDLSEGDEIDYWEWDFGDGTKSYVQNPSHSFIAGIYTVKLTVRDGALTDSVTKKQLITIYPTAKSPLLISGLKLWLDAQDSAFTLSGIYVNKWNDISGNNYHAYPTTTSGTSRPSKTTVGGKASVYFPAVSSAYDHLQLTGIVGNSLINATEGVTILVVSVNDTADDDRQGSFIGSDISVSGKTYPVFQSANHRACFHYGGTTTKNYVNFPFSSGTITPFPVDKNLNIQTVTMKPGNFVKVYRNGSLVGSGNSATLALGSATGVVHIGANSGADANRERLAFKGHIHAICVWNKVLTESERLSVETYFSQSSKFNVTDYSNWVPSIIPNVVGHWNCYASKKVMNVVDTVTYSSGNLPIPIYTYAEYFKSLYNLLEKGSALTCHLNNSSLPVISVSPATKFRGSTYVDFKNSSWDSYLSTYEFYPDEPAYPITMFGVFGYCNSDSQLLQVASSENSIQILSSDDKASLKNILLNTKVLVNDGFYFIMAYLNGYSGTSKLKINGVEVTGAANLNTYIEYIKMSGKFRFIDMIVAKGNATAYEAQVLAYYKKMTGGHDFTA